MYTNVLIKAAINQPTEQGPPDVTGTLVATGASGVTGAPELGRSALSPVCRGSGSGRGPKISLRFNPVGT